MEAPLRRRFLAILVPVFALAVPAAGASAQMRHGMMQSDQCEPGMGMMCMMGEHPRMTMRDQAMAQHVEQRIANLKARLKITDAQAPQWDAYAASLRDAAKAMGDQRAAMRDKVRAATLPERIALHEGLLVSQLEHLRKVKVAATALYAVLADDQKKIADTAVMGPMRRGPMRGPHRQ
jgi:hypothetical protein